MRPDATRKRPILSVGPSPQWDPAVSPDSKMLAFRGYYGPGDGEYALYVVGTDGCGVRRLTRSIAGSPSWSPDGRWIAYDTSGAGEIWKVHPNGTGRTRIARGAQSETPAWSPDRGRIAFVRHQRSGRGQIWIMGVDGSGATVLHQDRGASDKEPVWSHDGKRLAFVASAGKRSWVEVINADGSHARTVRTGSDPRSPTWLPSDTGIAFLASTTNGRSLFVTRADGSHVHQVATLGAAEQAAWAAGNLPRRRC